jgi:hypothetical protein
VPHQLDAVDDVAPLVGAAELELGLVPAVELQEVVGLQDHVVELEEGERRLARKPLLHTLEGKHAVDREVPAVLAQKAEVLDAGEPVVVVHHECVRRPVTERDELLEDLRDPRDVLIDLLLGHQHARRVLAGRVAHLGRPATYEHDRLVPASLVVAQ